MARTKATSSSSSSSSSRSSVAPTKRKGSTGKDSSVARRDKESKRARHSVRGDSESSVTSSDEQESVLPASQVKRLLARMAALEEEVAVANANAVPVQRQPTPEDEAGVCRWLHVDQFKF